jgi:hypothetical protein
MKRVQVRIGDVFSVPLDKDTKKYFQYVANDESQLGSDVIRAFGKAYPLDESPALESVVRGNVQFYAHVMIRLGLKMSLWEKVGHAADIGDLNVVFRGTDDYGTKLGEEPVRVSANWYVWKVNEEFRDVGWLEGDYRKAFVGLVINPCGILELLRGKKYPMNYPD